jgi:hypothetical protein
MRLTLLAAAALVAARPAAAESAARHGFEREVVEHCMATVRPRVLDDDAGRHALLECTDRLHAQVRAAVAAAEAEARAAERRAAEHDAQRPVWMRRDRRRTIRL